jgi:uncharacterized protein YjbI with pentapeptide repeats
MAHIRINTKKRFDEQYKRRECYNLKVNELRLFGASYNGIGLNGSSFYRCHFKDISIWNASLKGVVYEKSTLKNVDFSYSSFTNSTLSSSDFIKCSFFEADFDGARLIQSDFSLSDVSFEQLEGCDYIEDCTLSLSANDYWGDKLKVDSIGENECRVSREKGMTYDNSNNYSKSAEPEVPDESKSTLSSKKGSSRESTFANEVLWAVISMAFIIYYITRCAALHK